MAVLGSAPAIPQLDDAAVAFGDISALPAWSDLPGKYQTRWHRMPGGCRVAEALFYEGGRLSALGVTPKEGIDQQAAMRVIAACLRSWEPKHEHKIAGVGWLIDQWFEVVP